MLDSYMNKVIGKNPNMAIPWYLTANHAYHHLDRPIISDAAYDSLVKRLRKDWRGLKHRHKEIILESDLFTGSFSVAVENLPSIVRGATSRLHVKLERQRSKRPSGDHPSPTAGG